jgi:hypothetical protein
MEQQEEPSHLLDKLDLALEANFSELPTNTKPDEPCIPKHELSHQTDYWFGAKYFDVFLAYEFLDERSKDEPILTLHVGFHRYFCLLSNCES